MNFSNDGTPSAASYDQVDMKFEYPNYSRLKRNGQVYTFNNYNINTMYPITWTSRYDVFNPAVIAYDTISASDQSLLRYLVYNRHNNASSDQLLMFSRPSAWADINMTMDHHYDFTNITKLDSVTIQVSYEYRNKPTDVNPYVNVVIGAANKWFAPTFDINTTDLNNKKSGIGDIHRKYNLQAGSYVTVTAPPTYGRYVFDKWTDRSGTNLPPTPGVDISGGNKIKFNVGSDRNFKALYKFTGA